MQHRFTFTCALLAASALYAQAQPATAPAAPTPATAEPVPVEMTPAEREFQSQLTNVSMVGFFTVGDAPESKEDRYTIERIVKVGPDLWNFDARIQYNKRDFKATVKVPVKWAGDTPVITLANYLIKDHGVFSARILIHNGLYAGTWGAQSHGGKMFGKIVKNTDTPAPAATGATPPPPPAAAAAAKN